MNEIIEMIKAHEDSHLYNRLDESIKNKLLEVYPRYAEHFPFEIVKFAKEMGVHIINSGVLNGSTFCEKTQRFFLKFTSDLSQLTHADFVLLTRNVLCIICNSTHLKLCGNISEWANNNLSVLPQKLLPVFLVPKEQFLKMNELTSENTKKLSKHFGVSEKFIEKRKNNLIKK